MTQTNIEIETTHPGAYELASTAYDRYVECYERHHSGVTLLRWGALSQDVRQRWLVALTPLAELAEQAEVHIRTLAALRERLEHMKMVQDALRRRCQVVEEIREEMSESISLGQMTPKLAKILTKLVEAAHVD